MRADDLDLSELLDIDSPSGRISFAGERALLLDAVALGLLRKELIDTLGLTAARGVLTRFGYAHGWRTAALMEHAFPWGTPHEWHIAGGRLHRLQGLVRFEPVARGPGEPPRHFAQAAWHDSYEADQHLLHLGQSHEPVCWTLCGFASGYLSFCHGRAICCLEERCRGRGDALCVMAGRPRDEWPAEDQPQLVYFDGGPLDASLGRLTAALKARERRLRGRLAGPRPAAPPDDTRELVARSDGMRRLLAVAERVAPTDSTLLITGESGAGKEAVARFVHARSARAAGPFLAINCGAVPEGLIESELFGYARGAFTGAAQDRPGLLEAARGGTVLLDEIGELPPTMQVALLRALQAREVRRLGENRARPIDVRMMAATNRDLAADLTTGRFRRDLYYRLRVVALHVPPLRERRADILPLARELLAAQAARLNRRLRGFTPDAANRLLGHDWPGNVRELQNAIERAVALSSGPRILPEDLPEDIVTRPAVWTPGDVRTLADVERDYTLAVLEDAGGNRAQAAARLGIGVATLFRRLKAWESAGAIPGRRAAAES